MDYLIAIFFCLTCVITLQSLLSLLKNKQLTANSHQTSSDFSRRSLRYG
uniref:Uncharacterized protein n=1 Tax=Parascaris univalens TaxID=6257 RepID=A0A915A1P6_PARUN